MSGQLQFSLFPSPLLQLFMWNDRDKNTTLPAFTDVTRNNLVTS